VIAGKPARRQGATFGRLLPNPEGEEALGLGASHSRECGGKPERSGVRHSSVCGRSELGGKPLLAPVVPRSGTRSN
jgi:hypothetical protein